MLESLSKAYNSPHGERSPSLRKDILSAVRVFSDTETSLSHHKQFRAWASVKIDKQDRSTLIKRHAGCLGLASIILAFPYEVPEFLPGTIVTLARHAPDPDPIGLLVRKIIRDFWKTHYEQWDVHEKHFTEEELTILKGCIVSQAHYV
ncbi:hypothetical protein GEMRC1_013000 [Eukaryota sp. GEM-RC1]